MIDIKTQCPKCSAMISKLTPYCTHCGRKVMPQLTMESIKMCPCCGMLTSCTAVSCEKCGKQLLAAVPSQPTFIESVTCPGCGTALDSGARFCGKCGARIDSGAAAL